MTLLQYYTLLNSYVLNMPSINNNIAIKFNQMYRKDVNLILIGRQGGSNANITPITLQA